MIRGQQTDPGASHRLDSLDRAGEIRPVTDLEGTGISQVRLISQSQLGAAVRDAVAREILALAGTLDLAPADRERLIERAMARLDGRPMDPPVELRSAALPERPAPDLPDPEPIAEARESAPSTVRSADSDFDVEALENRIIEEVGRLVSANWREELRTAQDSQRNQIDRLEGRIDSLMKALDQIERLMDQQQTPPPTGSTPTSFIDTGALGGIKNELLEQLFEANLALRELEAGEEG